MWDQKYLQQSLNIESEDTKHTDGAVQILGITLLFILL